MKKLNLINKIAVAFAMLGLLMCVNMQSAYSQSGVGINTTDAAANANAMLDVQSTTKGVLLTPMTAAQANTAFGSSLSVAAQGLTVYITSGSAGPFTSYGYWYNTSSTTTPSWVSIGNGSVTLVATGYGLTGGPITTGGTLSADTTAYATSAHSGFLKYNDWTTFNAKQNALAMGNLTDAGTDGITVTNGTGSVIGSGTSIAQQKADGSHNGYLSSGDWTTFNGKGSGNGSVTSVSPGYGTNFSTITTTGSIVADTSVLINKTGTQTLTNKSISGSSNTVTNIGNSSLTNSSVTVSPGVDLTGGGAVSLGSSVTLNADTTKYATSTNSGFLNYADWTTFSGKGNGSITSVSPGYGTNFSTITTTGSIVADTSILINKTGTQTLTNKTISGSSNTVTNIGNSSLTNSSVTVSPGVDLTGGGAVSLGSSVTLNADTTQYSTSTNSGFLKYSDWTTFNAKQNALAIGNLTDAGTDGITVTNGTGSVIGSGTSVAQQKADGSHNGYLSSGDWTTFNGKGSGNGSVTSVSPGYGTNFSTITATGSIVADTSILINKTGTQTLTNKTISGSSNAVTNIGNSSLTNSSVTVSPGVDLTGGGAVSLGSSVTLNADTTQYATSAHSGFLKYSDWTTFNGKGSGNGSVTSVSPGYGTNFSAITTTGSIVADTSVLINKTGTQILTNKTISGSSNTVTNIGNSSLTNSSVTVSPGVDLTGGGAISLGSSVTLNADTTQYATSAHSGFLKYSDWTTFNNKQNALSLGTGVATALGMAVTGSGGIALATSPTFTTPVLGAATATSVNGLTLTANSIGFAIAGGTTSKTLTVSNSLTLAGNDGSTLNIGGGGTLGSNAYTSTAYAPLASPTFTGTVTMPTPFTLGSTSVTSTGTQLNYLNAATGTTGTTSSNLVFSASPTFTGTPAAPTATAGTSTTQIATTAFVANNFAPTGTLIARKIITSGTTVSIDAGTNAILVELIGGGGGGGGTNGSSSKTDCGSGGGAGGYTSYYLSGPASSYTCAIGAGGSGGPNTGGAGSDGGGTTITVSGTTISANGGHKGTNTGQVNNPFSVAGGAGAATGANGTFMTGGVPGEIGLCTGTNTGGGGNGGSSVYGGGGLGPVVSTATSNGANATGYGGGGSGSASGTSGTGGTGGNGSGGCIIVWEYR